MLPHAGQGANQALEDAMALGTLLGGAHVNSAPAILRRYEAVRVDRARRVQQESRALGRRYDSRYDDLQLRDRELEEYADFKRWLIDHDAQAHALASRA
jgi:salicylate hydroxylase